MKDYVYFLPFVLTATFVCNFFKLCLHSNSAKLRKVRYILWGEQLPAGSSVLRSKAAYIISLNKCTILIGNQLEVTEKRTLYDRY